MRAATAGVKCPFLKTWGNSAAKNVLPVNTLQSMAVAQGCPFMSKHGQTEPEERKTREPVSMTPVRQIFTTAGTSSAAQSAVKKATTMLGPSHLGEHFDGHKKKKHSNPTLSSLAREVAKQYATPKTKEAKKFDYEGKFKGIVNDLKEEGRYRVFQHHRRQVGKHPVVVADTGQEVTMWCSNDYLGMGHHPKVITAMRDTLEHNGAGAGGTRNIAGSSYFHKELEAELASLHNKGASLLFNSCFIANDTALTTLGKLLPDCVMVSDESNHASLIQGIRNARVDKAIFRHNDVDHLHSVLSKYPTDKPKVVVFESVYSMCGSIAPLDRMLEVCENHGALSFLDEVHAVGMYGDQGAGVAEQDGVMDRVDIISATLGKAVGVGGGYIAASAPLVDTIRSFAPGFIFSTAPSPVIASGALASVRHLRADPSLRNKMKSSATTLKGMLTSAGLPVVPSPSHILPILVGDAAKTKAIADDLLSEFSIYIQPINYPTVDRGTERLRVTTSPYHEPVHMEALVSALTHLFKKYDVRTWTDAELMAIKG